MDPRPFDVPRYLSMLPLLNESAAPAASRTSRLRDRLRRRQA